MSDEEQIEPRELIEEIVNEGPVQEESKQVVKARAGAKAKTKVNIIREPVETVVGETIVEEPIEEEKPKTNDKLKEMVKCPDCKLSMTQHKLKYINKRRNYCKGVPQEAEPIEEQQEDKSIVKSPRQPPGLQEQAAINPTNITNDIVNQYIQEHPGIVSTYLRNKRPLKAQRKHMHVRSLLNSAFEMNLFYFILYITIKHGE